MVALMEAGFTETDARDTAAECYDNIETPPAKRLAEIYREAEEGVQRETVRMHALRAVRDRWCSGTPV